MSPAVPSTREQDPIVPAGPPFDAAALDAVIALVRERDGIDLSGYRRSTLGRRVRNRMISAAVADAAAYLARLRAEPAETGRLLDRITIKVSRFFRNRDATEAVSRALAAAVGPARPPLTVWSAGCGRGEEPYTLAILLAELGQTGGGEPPVLGTDIDPGALEAARAATYGPEALVEVPAGVRERWLVPADRPGAVRVAPGLRTRVALERHDLAREGVPARAPFDLVSCRNTLIYFDAALQRRVLGILCDALAPGGLLWLGEAEWPSGPAADRLALVDRAARLFRRSDGRRRA